MFYNSKEYEDYTINESSKLSAKRKESEYNNSQSRLSLMEMRDRALVVKKEYNKFLSDTKSYLVTEAINFVAQNVLNANTNVTDVHRGILHNLSEQFVKDNDAEILLKNFETKTKLLAEMHNIIEESYTHIMEETDPEDPNTFVIKTSDNSEYFKKLNGMNLDQVSNVINKRILDATSEFLSNNVRDKEEIEQLASDIKEKIDSVKHKNKDTEEEIKQEFANLYRTKLNDIHSSRNRNIFEHMVRKTTESVLLNEEAKKSFLNESGSLNTDKVIESVEIMYAFLETVNTTKMIKINESYLEELINTIK